MRRKRVALLTLLLLAGLVAVPVVLTWRQVRLERLNHALIAAVDRNDTAVVRRLLRQGADPNTQTSPDEQRSVWQRVLDWVRHFSVSVGDAHESALMRAIDWWPTNEVPYDTFDNADLVEVLVDAGAVVNVRDTIVDPMPVATTARTWSTSPIIEVAAHYKFKCVQVLLAHNADVNARGVEETTSLMGAARCEMPDMVETLLKRGANVNAKDVQGQTALYYAVFPGNFNGNPQYIEDTVACLLRYGALVNTRDRTGQTPLSLARTWGDKKVIQMLQRAGAK